MTLSIDPSGEFIRFLETHAIRVRDIEELSHKVRRIRAAGPDKFQVISDFDKTLTPQWLRDPCSRTGKLRACHASHGVIESSELVSDKFRTFTHALAKKFIPIEHNHHLSVTERTEAVIEWYQCAHEAMLEENLTKRSLDDIVHACWSHSDIHLRSESLSFFKSLACASIPATVLSAGLRDVIERIFALEQVVFNVADQGDDETDSPFMVVSNRMQFNTEGAHVGFSEPIIHAFNKRDALHRFLIKSEMRSNRPNALVMGDLIADVDFVHSIPNLDEYIAIGFLADGGPPDRLDDYLKHFDIVILGGSAGMQVAIELIRALTV
jgi:HAD superfamily hydrolase (TIGR01544 family)